VVGPQEPDHIFDELLPPVGVGDQGREPRGALIPPADGEQRFELFVVALQSIEFGVATFLLI